MNDAHLTTREASDRLGIPYHTLMRRVYAGKILATRRGRQWWISEVEIARLKRAAA